MNLGEQIEPNLFKRVFWNPKKPWKIQRTMWRRYPKIIKVRSERRRAKQDPECQPLYKKYDGWLL